MFRVTRATGQIEFIDNGLYDGPSSKLPLQVVALFGTTSGGKSTTCRFLSCSMGVPTNFPSSTIGPQHEPTRGLWGSPVVDADGKHYIILDIEGFDNSEQDQKVAEAVLKLLALLSEVTSVFVQVRRTPTIQASDLEYIASFVSQVRSTLLKRPVATRGDAGPNDNFPALLIAHVMPVHLSHDEQEAKAVEITRQALASQPEVIKTVSENYIELVHKEGLGLHFDYLTIYELPMFEKLQRHMDTAETPDDLLEKVRNLVDFNKEESSPKYKAGQTFLDDIDLLRDKIWNVSRARIDGRGRAITPQTFRQLLKWGVEEMNKIGPLSNVYLWEKIAIDACTKQLQDKIDALEARLKAVMEGKSGGLAEAMSDATRELDDFFEGLNLRPSGKAREACERMKASTWALVVVPFKDQVLLEVDQRFHEAEQQAEDARRQATAARQQADAARHQASAARQQADAAQQPMKQDERRRKQKGAPSTKGKQGGRITFSTTFLGMRQLEFDLVEARAQLHMARDWPSPPGLQTETSKLRESIYRLVSDDSNATVETLEELWRHATKTQKLDLRAGSFLFISTRVEVEALHRQPDAAVSPVWTAEDLADADFDWTIIDGKVHAIDGFIPAHPGGRLIWSAVGQEATDLFRAHHASKAAEVALEKCFVGHFSTQRPRKRLQEGDIGFRAELNKRVSHLLKKPMIPVAEATAVSMLLLFCFWAFLTYVEGSWAKVALMVVLAERTVQLVLVEAFSILRGCIISCFVFMQCSVTTCWTTTKEIFTMLSTCMNGASQVLEPPASKAKLLERCKDVASWWAEALLSPGYQGASFLFQPFWHALAALLLSRAAAKLVLLPFAEVQHFLMPDAPSHEDFVLQQLSTTANLRFTSAAARLLDFLMFHGDSLQVEHHLWPAMSFVQLQEASRTVKATCRELGLPYTEIGYFEAFLKVWKQVRDHVLEDELRYLAKPEAGMSRRAAELKKAEAMHGELHKEREDVFRALARALAPGLNARDLAAVTVHTAEQEDETVERPDGGGKSLQAEGYLGQVFEALRDRSPLPTAPVQWDRQDVVNCLRTLVGAWAPLRVELHDSLSGVEVFPQQKESRSQKKQKKKQKKHKEQPAEAEIELKLVFLPGCGELHGVVGQKCSKEQVQALKSKREELLEQCREDYCLLETFHGGQGRYSRAELLCEQRSWWGMRCKIGREALLAALWVGSASASSEYLAALCPSETCNEMSHPLLDFDQDTRECVCRSHPCWDDNGQLHTCRGQSGFPYLAFFYNEKKELQCECSSFPHYSSLYISRDLCAGHRCLDPAHPVLDYDDAKDECVCRSHPCWNDKGRSHKCDKPQFPILKFRHEEVNGRLKNVCECSISMEKDQSVPIMPFDKPGADPNEEEFEEDEDL
ncbi:fadB [Symbiodinium sp. KB8]|nr:fadB [Symbiodinium sp. KB8]